MRHSSRGAPCARAVPLAALEGLAALLELDASHVRLDGDFDGDLARLGALGHAAMTWLTRRGALRACRTLATQSLHGSAASRAPVPVPGAQLLPCAPRSSPSAPRPPARPERARAACLPAAVTDAGLTHVGSLCALALLRLSGPCPAASDTSVVALVHLSSSLQRLQLRGLGVDDGGADLARVGVGSMLQLTALVLRGSPAATVLPTRGIALLSSLRCLDLPGSRSLAALSDDIGALAEQRHLLSADFFSRSLRPA